GGKLPDWLATHPNPGARIQHITSMLDTVHRDLSHAVVNHDGYLQHVQNMVYGEDPREGFFEGSTFYHPKLRFQATFPQGWQTQNTPQAVAAQSPQQDAIIQLALAGQTPPEEAARQFMSQQGVQPGNASTTTVNGLPAAGGYFTAQTDQGTVEGLA